MRKVLIGADMFCREMNATGRIKLEGTQVGGRLDLEDARLDDPRGNAPDGRSLQAGQFVLTPSGPVRGLVDLQHARVGLLRDDPDRWPGAMALNGLTYETLEPRLPARQRLRWLALDPDGYQPQPYEHLASRYALVGQAVEARRILLANQRAHRRTSTPLGKVWGVIQDAAVGYGYQSWRAVLWLALLVTVGTVVYGMDPPKPLKPGEAPHFNPVVYTLDLLLPLVDLGQERAYNPAGAHQWFSYALVAAGWILVTVIAASRRPRPIPTLTTTPALAGPRRPPRRGGGCPAQQGTTCRSSHDRQGAIGPRAASCLRPPESAAAVPAVTPHDHLPTRHLPMGQTPIIKVLLCVIK